MKCFLISEKDEQVSGFKQMGVEAVLSNSDEMAVSEVEKAISCRRIGTLILSRHVTEAAKPILDSHARCGRLPFIMTLKD